SVAVGLAEPAVGTAHLGLDHARRIWLGRGQEQETAGGWVCLPGGGGRGAGQGFRAQGLGPEMRRDGVAHQQAQFVVVHHHTSSVFWSSSTMPMIAASTGAPLRPSASPAALPSITNSTRSPTPAPTLSI